MIMTFHIRTKDCSIKGIERAIKRRYDVGEGFRIIQLTDWDDKQLALMMLFGEKIEYVVNNHFKQP